MEHLRTVEKLPILATRSGLQGYYFAASVADIERYEKELKNHALRELKTLSLIKADYFKQSQPTFTF